MKCCNSCKCCNCRILILCFLLCALVALALASIVPWDLPTETEIAKLSVARKAPQIFVVGATSNAMAKAALYSREENGFKKVLETTAYIGKKGLGKTKEDDGKTPVGQFNFTKAFGIAKNPGSKMNYTQVNEHHYWVSDSASHFYNQFVVDSEVPAFNKKESEHLIDYTLPYQYALSISYNADNTPNLGSAIFLECYSEHPYTGGCVAIPKEDMVKVINLVEPECVVIIDYIDMLRLY